MTHPDRPYSVHHRVLTDPKWFRFTWYHSPWESLHPAGGGVPEAARLVWVFVYPEAVRQPE